MPDQLENLKDDESKWRYPKVPEARIKDLAVKAASEATGLSKEWCERIHDFQWKYAYESLEVGKSVKIPYMMRILQNTIPAYKEIHKLVVKRVKLREMEVLETQRQFTDLNPYRRRQHKIKSKELGIQIKELTRQIDRLVWQLTHKTAKPKKNGNKKDNRGDVQQLVGEGTGGGDSQSTDTDL
jgi:hypothetical protein